MENWLPPHSYLWRKLQWFKVLHLFFHLHPLVCFCPSLPPLPTAPSLHCPWGTSMPRRSGLHVTHAAEVRLPAELHGCAGTKTRPGKDLCRQHTTSLQPTCCRTFLIPSPSLPGPLPGKEQTCLFHLPVVRHGSLCSFKLLSRKKSFICQPKSKLLLFGGCLAGFSEPYFIVYENVITRKIKRGYDNTTCPSAA